MPCPGGVTSTGRGPLLFSCAADHTRGSGRSLAFRAATSKTHVAFARYREPASACYQTFAESELDPLLSAPRYARTSRTSAGIGLRDGRIARDDPRRWCLVILLALLFVVVDEVLHAGLDQLDPGSARRRP